MIFLPEQRISPADQIAFARRFGEIESPHPVKRRHVAGDIMLVDTLQTLHRGTRLEFTIGDHDARLLWNIALKGAPECVSDWHPCEPPSLNA